MKENSKKEKLLFGFRNLGLLIVSILLSLIGAELVSRALGIMPWTIEKHDIIVQPDGRLYRNHATLGYTQLSGEFKITLFGDYAFNVTHLENGLRITQALLTYNDEHPRDEIWIFGCSFTYGWCLNDEETYPWLLQKRLPSHKIVNFSANGYGTVHSLIQFKEALKERDHPAAIILTYAWFHDVRNTYLRSRKKGLAYSKRHPLSQPYARFDSKGKLNYSMSAAQFREFPLMRYSAFLHLFEAAYHRFESRYYRSHDVSKAIIKDFQRICQKREIPFVVAGILSDPVTLNMLDYTKTQDIMTVDISVDLNREGYRNLPYDAHPSATANIGFAQKLEFFLRNTILHRLTHKVLTNA